MNREQVKNYAIVGMFFLCFIAMPAQAVIVKEKCLNDTYLQLTFDFEMVTDDISINHTYSQVHKCLNGCSETLGKCRWNKYNSNIYVLILVVSFIGCAMFAINFGSIFEPVLLIILITFALLIHGTDVFVLYNKFVLLAVSLGLIGITGTSLAQKEIES